MSPVTTRRRKIQNFVMTTLKIVTDLFFRILLLQLHTLRNVLFLLPSSLGRIKKSTHLINYFYPRLVFQRLDVKSIKPLFRPSAKIMFSAPFWTDSVFHLRRCRRQRGPGRRSRPRQPWRRRRRGRWRGGFESCHLSFVIGHGFDKFLEVKRMHNLCLDGLLANPITKVCCLLII